MNKRSSRVSASSIRAVLEAHGDDLLEAVLSVLDAHRVTLEEAAQATRLPDMVAARVAAWRLLRERGWSYPRIARLWGYDHTSVMSALRQAPRSPRPASPEAALRREVEELVAREIARWIDGLRYAPDLAKTLPQRIRAGEWRRSHDPE